MKSFLFSILAILVCFPAHSAKLDKLGQRFSSCKNLTGDDFQIEYDSVFRKEAQNLFEDDKLTMAILSDPGCLRVGTEIRLYTTDSTIPYLGRGLIQSMETMTRSKLLKTKTPFTKSAIQDFVKAHREREYAVINLKVVEKIEETSVNTQYERLPSCFPSYGDWKTMRLKDGQETLVTNIQKQRVRAQIWNGTFNCYKVGVRAAITIPSKKGENLGNIIPTELHLIHYTNLKSKHAKALGMSLSALKKKMAESKDIEGGYTTMVMFDYEKERPPKPEEADRSLAL